MEMHGLENFPVNERKLRMKVPKTTEELAKVWAVPRLLSLPPSLPPSLPASLPPSTNLSVNERKLRMKVPKTTEELAKVWAVPRLPSLQSFLL